MRCVWGPAAVVRPQRREQGGDNGVVAREKSELRGGFSAQNVL